MRSGLRQVDPVLFVLVVIVLLGALLRLYEFHDWLRFNYDQARDATVAFNISKGELPLLGPLAGGTEFRLGPIIHYFQYLSGALFGFAPSVLAYPDALFSILFIPLVYALVSRMFGKRLGLMAAFLCAISGFMIRYGRFAWNPNSMPFFATLFVLSGWAFIDRASRFRYWWAALFGIALGVGVQLHTFLLVALPLLTVSLFGFLAFRRMLPFRMAGVAIGLALLLNVPQLLHEIRNDFSNTRAFFSGVATETESRHTIPDRFLTDLTCHVRANGFALSSAGDTDDCNRYISKISKNPWEDPIGIVSIALEYVFTIGGFLLLGIFAWKEHNPQKRYFAVAILGYSVILFALVVPVANEVSMRYFLANAFVPFVLFAVWGRFLLARGRVLAVGFFLLFIGLTVSNVLFAKEEFELYQTGKVSDGDMSVLGEMEPLAVFVARETPVGETAHLMGMLSYRRRFAEGIAYLLRLEGKDLIRWETKKLPEEQGPVFHIRKKTRSYEGATEIDGLPILDKVTSGRVTIYLLRR